MNKTLYLVVFALAMATAVALAQTSAGGASTQAQPASPAWGPPSQTTPASQDTGQHDKKKDKSPVDDASLTTQVQQQLAGDPALKNVQATVNNGVVNLDGTVASKADKKRAKQVVAAIPGVRKVHDRLTVNANATVTPGSNEPTTAKAGAGSSASGNTAGSIAGDAGASSTTPQAPAAAAGNTASRESGASANGMPQSDVVAGANAGTGVSGASSGTAASTIPQSSTGAAGAAGAASSTIPQSSTAGTAGAPATGAGDISTDLQKQVQTALKHEPTLANDNIDAVVTGDTIDLSGTMATGKERQTALRIAQSFAGNRRVADHMTVAGQGAGANIGEPQRDTAPGASDPSSLPSSPNPSPESTHNPR